MMPKGFKHSEETKLKMSNSQKGRIFSVEHRNNLSKAKKGKSNGVMLKETKLKISNSHKNNEKNWMNNQKQTTGEYIRIWNSKKRKHELEHRLIMEKHLGRQLFKDERIHHINGDKSDNRFENLMLFKNESEHKKWHYNDNKL